MLTCQTVFKCLPNASDMFVKPVKLEDIIIFFD